MAEVSTKPYLVRAIHEWCVDSGYRPFIAVLVDERTLVPHEFVRNGEIVLNISAVAANRLRIGNELLEFEARFSGVARQVSIPIENIRAIFAQETGHGMAFEIAPALTDDGPDAPAASEDAPVSPAAETGASIDPQQAGGRTGDARPAKRARKTVLRDVSAGITGEARPKSAVSKTTPGGGSAGAKRSRKPTIVEAPEDAKHRPAQGRTRRDTADTSPPDDDGPGPGAPAPGKPRLTRVK